MLTIEHLKNIKVFLSRVPMTGQEAIGWCTTMAAIEAEISAAQDVSAAPAQAAHPMRDHAFPPSVPNA